MTTSPAVDTAASRCLFYRRECGLPAAIQPGLQQITVPVGSVGAITMPAQLGIQVRGYLHHRGDRTGPIVGHPRSNRWTYLVLPDIPDDMSLFSILFRLNVILVGIGAQIALPSPDDTAGFRQWVQPPLSLFRPSGQAVVAAARACAPNLNPRRDTSIGESPSASLRARAFPS